MRICVLSGSPKGKNSITFQTVRYIARMFPDCEFATLHVGQKIRAYERDMTAALDTIKKADMLLFCYPVYTFLVPCQLHRFIELLKESGVDLSGKCAAQISTSKHFYDTTAHAFIRENCADMGLRCLGGLSADMDDLTKPKGQKDAVDFWNLVLWRAEHGYSDITMPSAHRDVPAYERAFEDTPKTDGREVVIVANMTENDRDLAAMIDDFRAKYPHSTRVVNVMDYPFSGGCLGCFGCAADGTCVYKDGFDDFLRNEIQTADAIVYAFTVKDHSMGARMKMYDDRQFCNGHRTVTIGMPVGYLVYGDLANEPNLRMVMEGRADVGQNFLAGIATDADGIAALSDTLEYALETKIVMPQMFLGVGGMKIFRDLIWIMQGMMKADHEFYREHGMYDFPQKEAGRILMMKVVGAMISNPKIKSKMGNKMTEGMLMPYEKVLKKCGKRK